ncbi:helix-turn-helix domain-containing protein [Phenylobacterium sp.]|uniref:helix-turn-helix domain-containing protein n=1 Tax=Phenylobacterium sp. TaxID=1871053 RepID=UPI0039838749
MARIGTRISFARDDEIYGQEEVADLIYQVVSGAVRTSRLMNDGRRQVGDFYYQGEVFGMEPGREHVFSAEALADTVVLVVKRSVGHEASGGMLEQLLGGAARRELERAHEHVLMLGRKTACEKVASLLMNIADRSHYECVELPMGRQDMADYLGLTIETVSRMLTQLQLNAVVEFAGLRSLQVKNRQALSLLTQ